MGLGPPIVMKTRGGYRAPNDSEWVFVRFVTHSLSLGARFSGEWVFVRFATHSLTLGARFSGEWVL